MTYNTPEGPHERKVTISGGLTETFGDIPLNSEMLKLHITFIGMINDDNYDLHWDKPLGEWLTGQRHIEMSGVWPGETKRVDREAK